MSNYTIKLIQPMMYRYLCKSMWHVCVFLVRVGQSYNKFVRVYIYIYIYIYIYKQINKYNVQTSIVVLWFIFHTNLFRTSLAARTRQWTYRMSLNK